MLKYRTMTDCKRLFQTVLKGWKVRKSKKVTFPHVEIDEKRKRAVVFPFGINIKVEDGRGKTKVIKVGKTPSDYMLHEFLHVCMRVVMNAKDRYWREEQLVRIICDLVDNNKRTSGTRRRKH